MTPLLIIAAFAGLLPAQSGSSVPFRFSSQAERTRIWGGGPPIPRSYFPGDLPALFTRTIEIEGAIPPGSVLEWIFTGDEGGFTVRIAPGSVRVAQRYYDSYGHSSTKPPKARYPERVWDESEAAYSGDPRSVNVTLDHQFGLLVSVNGTQLIRQTCVLDVRRHQLGWMPAEGAPPAGVSGRVTAPPAIEATVRVDAARRHQSIVGFGGIVSAPAYTSLSAEGKRRWWKLLAEYNLLIHREYPNGNRLKPDLSNFGRLEDATPHYYGDNFPNGEISDFDYIRQLRSLGGRVWFEFWELPPWARQGGGKEPVIAEYVRAMVGYCRVSLQKTGKPPDVVGVQNEVVQSAETWHAMVLALRKGLDAAGFASVKIHMPDNGRLEGGIATARAIRQSPAAWKAIDFAATHVYDFQRYYENPDGYDALIGDWRKLTADKSFLSTELTVNASAWQSRGYRTALAQAELYHKNMALMDAAALAYCWLLLDVEQPIFAATRSLFTADRSRGFVPVASSYQLRTFGAFSRRLREGMTRVAAESDSPDVLVTAYEGAPGRTVVLINRSTVARQIKLEWPGARFGETEYAGPYLENSVQAASSGPILVQPGELVTLTNVPLRD